MEYLWLLPFGILLGGSITGLIVYITQVPASRKSQPVGSAEVSDLIDRLRPLVENPDKPWYLNGLTLTFYATSVQIKLKMPNGNVYHGEGRTLGEAVDRITTPSDDIRKALGGWKLR